MVDAAIRQRLLARAFLHDDPDSYTVGVLDALDELDRAAGRGDAGAAEPEPLSRQPLSRKPA